MPSHTPLERFFARSGKRLANGVRRGTQQRTPNEESTQRNLESSGHPFSVTSHGQPVTRCIDQRLERMSLRRSRLGVICPPGCLARVVLAGFRAVAGSLRFILDPEIFVCGQANQSV
ncbi:uncharacterized protein SETTUDRAFT_168551 [Exserohilum turcica Et28A]|uniref:Uncharacterized protein n=1 Tax=Exserohilum turcicum (strain 28A) TaxID=671987 RepID=R0KFR3_EXST2|nr:uncharacterized protein SETTUDRAFT_168551 [Exserohilum turcica Et28A]EOA88129.1 hypothetical protein SETTUDRAFT_168551 [Exserohilum turcica Et28A]